MDTQILYPTQKYPPRGKHSRLGKQNPSDPSIRAYEIKPDKEKDLPFTTSKIRVGVGGDMLVLQLINDEYPFVLKNIADGETIHIRACRILESDCSNIVIFE